MRPFGTDLRRRILEVPETESSAVVAARFSVSESFVRKLRQRARAGRGVEPLPYPGRERMIRDGDEAALARLVAEYPDATLNVLRELFADAVGISVSEATLCRQLQRMGMTLRKRPS
jgi:transposase